ncbi:hypothetical protein [Clostridium sp.]|uniref:hypothetical protein n=1 Tax=Clostridium sp. TaxID=1506 RepID=UPI003994AD7F
MKQIYMKNLQQANFFLENGVVPVKLKFEKGIVIAVFNRDKKCEEIFTKWIESKQLNR